MSMNFHRKLPIPQEVKKEFPLTPRMEQVKAERDESIRAVFEGRSDKFILVIGPCSAEHKEPVLEYISRLRRIQEQVADRIIIVPRIYTNKPRTTGRGYKGMLHQPDPDAKPDMYKGIVAIRELHLAALKDYDFSCADEMLYPENYRYLSDLLSYDEFVENIATKRTPKINIGWHKNTIKAMNACYESISTGKAVKL